MIGFFVGLILGGSFGALFRALFWAARGRKDRQAVRQMTAAAVFDNQKVAAHPEIRMRGDFSDPIAVLYENS